MLQVCDKESQGGADIEFAKLLPQVIQGISHSTRSLLVLGCPLVFSCFLPPLGMSLLNTDQILLWAQNEAATGLVLLNRDPI